MTRTVRETVPGALANVPATHAARNTYLTNLSRDLSANAAYLIGTRYGDVPSIATGVETRYVRLCLDPLILPGAHFLIICYTMQNADLQITTEGDARGVSGGLPVPAKLLQPLQSP